MKEYKKKIDDAVEKAGDNFKKMKEQQQDDNPPAKKLKKAVESGKNEAKNEKDREDGWKDLDREKDKGDDVDKVEPNEDEEQDHYNGQYIGKNNDDEAHSDLEWIPEDGRFLKPNEKFQFQKAYIMKKHQNDNEVQE